MNLKNYEKRLETRVRKFKDDYYLLSNRKSYLLNYTGAVVIKYIGDDIELEDVAKKISDFYREENLEKIKTDIESFIEFLVLENLIINRV
ncbi:hypothetical protein [Streptococcus sanguinis]|uniref:hypothetical protein n=2 Tax=Streptococcus sanguinis TaxID=1305 RepID=UPI001CC0CB77|nr:hypothetical protein [Streptococcus sanguinis]MBZ2040307.1 hypothetical protein [Streptococcus sanguinis]